MVKSRPERPSTKSTTTCEVAACRQRGPPARSRHTEVARRRASPSGPVPRARQAHVGNQAVAEAASRAAYRRVAPTGHKPAQHRHPKRPANIMRRPAVRAFLQRAVTSPPVAAACPMASGGTPRFTEAATGASAAPSVGFPYIPVQRNPGDINDVDLLLDASVDGTTVDWVFPVADIGTTATQFLKGSPADIAKIEAEVGKALLAATGKLTENTTYLGSAPVAADVQKDVQDWPGKRGLTVFPARIAARAEAVKATRLRYPLESQLAMTAGITPAQIDWRKEVEAMRGRPPQWNTMIEASRADRFELALSVLQEEAVVGPQPAGDEPLHTDVMSPLIYAKYAETDPPPSELDTEQMKKTHSEAFLATWLPKIRDVRLVPDGFDLAPFAPTGDLDPVRKALVIRYLDEAAPRTMEKYLLDMWVADASGRSAEQFLQTADLGKVRDALLAHLARDFHRWAVTQPGFRGAFWGDVGQRVVFAAVTTMFIAARAVQAYNATLADRFQHENVFNLDHEEFGIAEDPYNYLERLESASAVTTGLVQRLAPGKSFEANLLDWYDGIAAAWSPGSSDDVGGARVPGRFPSDRQPEEGRRDRAGKREQTTVA